MVRQRTLLAICLLLVGLLGGVAFADDPPPAPVDPVEVGRLLLSPDEAARQRGVELLLRRIGEGGDLEAFLRAMAAAQAGAAAPAAAGSPSLGEEARDAIERLFREAEALRQRLANEPESAAAQTPTAAAAVEELPAPQRAALPPVRAAVAVVEVDRSEFDRWTAAAPTAGDLLAAVAGLPGARTLARGEFGLGPDETDLLEAQVVTYREGVTQTKTGAYAVRSGRIHEGLRILASATRSEEGALNLRLLARFTEVPRPMPSARVRPADDVEAIELDVPEWRSAASSQEREAPAGATATFTFVDVVPGKVVVVGVDPLG